MLEVRNLRKATILNGIDLDMESGEMIAVMGPSGSGKSTLLYQLAGMDRPDDGEIRLERENIAELSEDACARLRLETIGFVFQQMNVMPNLNLMDNILFPALQLEKRRREEKCSEVRGTEQLQEEAKALMDKLGIGMLSRRQVTEVSGGQLQRACICRALINHPSIVYADEPTGALNQKASREVMKEFVRLNRAGTSILMVTHDAKVAGMCDRVFYLVDGKVEGELVLGKYSVEDREKREEKMKEFLELRER